MPNVNPNQDLFKFLSLKQGDKNSFQNLELLWDLEIDYPGIFEKTVTNFDKVIQYRETLDENGKPKKVSWKDAIKKLFVMNKYTGITKDNEDIATLFTEKDLAQEVFDKASNLRKKAKEIGIKEHILEKPLKEDTILESIEKIKKNTNDELVNAKEAITKLYNKQFSYEWLSKNDPKNFIIGLYCSCCATITGEAYGKDIAESTIISDDVQNLVIRDIKGNIVSKGAVYVNKKEGFAVINEFELNEHYKKHEYAPGKYNVEINDKEEEERELIFKAYQRGIKAFIEEYDKQNPDNPLKQINVGMGYNRLKRQVLKYERTTSNLSIPFSYNFKDAMINQQYVLYKRKEKEQEKFEQEKQKDLNQEEQER